MPNGKPKIQIVTPRLLVRLDGATHGPDDRMGFSD
jgi:hypothetical protein